jgi:hypothetical protein
VDGLKRLDIREQKIGKSLGSAVDEAQQDRGNTQIEKARVEAGL